MLVARVGIGRVMVKGQLSTSLLFSPEKLPFFVYQELLMATQNFVVWASVGPGRPTCYIGPQPVPSGQPMCKLRGIPQMCLIVG
jgi:hypothetical protein